MKLIGPKRIINVSKIANNISTLGGNSFGGLLELTSTTDTIRYEMLFQADVRPKANINQLNLPH